MSLPQELRTIIYKMTLCEPHSVFLVNFKVPGRACRSVLRGHELRAGHEGLTWGKQQGKWLGLAPSNLAITQVNHEVSLEALPVAYGDNTFKFFETSDMVSNTGSKHSPRHDRTGDFVWRSGTIETLRKG